MSEEKKPELVTTDSKLGFIEAAALTGDPLIKINTPEALLALCEMAQSTHSRFAKSIESKMTLARAQRIRELRQENSWRGVAYATCEEWGEDADWWPKSNQLAGMALCECAAKLLNEDPEKEPWN